MRGRFVAIPGAIFIAIAAALWGTDARGYHLTNVALHAANAALVYVLARAMFARAGMTRARQTGAALAALLFALHPLRVESVAWVTERRDVLSTFFLLLTVLAPTDAAFKQVPKATLRAVQRNPKLLKRVLLYHVIKGKVPSTTVVTLKSAKTLAGPAVKIRVTGKRVFVNNARVTTVDVTASNGVIHVINRVLIPPK